MIRVPPNASPRSRSRPAQWAHGDPAVGKPRLLSLLRKEGARTAIDEKKLRAFADRLGMWNVNSFHQGFLAKANCQHFTYRQIDMLRKPPSLDPGNTLRPFDCDPAVSESRNKYHRAHKDTRVPLIKDPGAEGFNPDSPRLRIHDLLMAKKEAAHQAGRSTGVNAIAPTIGMNQRAVSEKLGPAGEGFPGGFQPVTEESAKAIRTATGEDVGFHDPQEWKMRKAAAKATLDATPSGSRELPAIELPPFLDPQISLPPLSHGSSTPPSAPPLPDPNPRKPRPMEPLLDPGPANPLADRAELHRAHKRPRLG